MGRFVDFTRLARAVAAAAIAVSPIEALAQTSPDPMAGMQHDHAAMQGGWRFMQDGVVFGTYNDQGGKRASREFKSQNWWMGMAHRGVGRGEFRAHFMFSLEPATVGGKGYAELFQLGETYKGLANTDRQHPHDFLMQAAVSWRQPIGDHAAVTIGGAPVGEATLGPVAFMHRMSAAENPTAPLSHHTFDSTHITMGVVAGAFDWRGLTIEASAFQGREPDDKRWDVMDPGSLDSYAARVWFRHAGWAGQVSYGSITKPERLELLDVERTTASLSWSRRQDNDFTAISLIAGENKRPYDRLRAVLLEGTHRWHGNTAYGRIERVDLESEHLLFPLFPHKPHPGELIDAITATTIGGVRDLFKIGGVSIGAGADVTFYRVPNRLKSTHGDPKSFHIFFRISPASLLGRMWDATMLSPMSSMAGHKM